MAYNTSLSAHKIKAKIYPALFKPFGKRKVRKILTLCSTTCGELIYALKKGHIDLDCEILTFQKSTDYIKPEDVENKLRELGFTNFTVIPGDMMKHSLEIIKSHLARPIELLFLDWCGTFNANVYNFLNEISSVIHDTVSAHTYCMNLRHREYLYDTEENVREFDLEDCTSDLSVTGININRREGIGYVKERTYREIAEWTCSMHFEALVDDYPEFDNILIYKEAGQGKQTMMFGVYGASNKPGCPYHRKVNEETLAKLEAEKTDTTAYTKGAQKSWTLRRNKERSLSNLRNQWHNEPKAAKKAWIKRAINEINRGDLNHILRHDVIIAYKPGNVVLLESREEAVM